MSNKYTMHVISHTHWDREWYRSFQHFRTRLVDLIDHLINLMETDPDYRYFHLDGQTIMLDDYLQIRPENEAILRKLVKEGRILIGPWYNQPDEFLVSAEAMVRNLALGRRMGDDWGNWMRIGYVPDCFGHISQFPQIMRGFGIDNAALFRGITADQVKSEFTWRSPDGSEILCVKMPDDNAYSNFYYKLREALSSVKPTGDVYDAGTGRRGDTVTDRIGTWEGFGLPVNGEQSTVNSPEWFQKAREQIAELVNDCVNERPTTENLLFMDGVDHIFANPMVPAIIKDANKNLDLGTLVHSTLPEFVKAVQAANPNLQTVEGELRISNRKWKLQAVLAGVMSSRVHLKQANHELQTLLEKWAEPWSAIAWTLGKEHPTSYIELAWKYVLQNHPHDSICGCSVDQVHKDMVYRFDQARLIAQPVATKSLLYVCDRIDTATKGQADGETGGDEHPTSNAQLPPSNMPENPKSEIRNPHSLALVVFNSLSWERSEVVEAEVNIPHNWPAQGLIVTDADGNEVPFQVLEVGSGGSFYQEWHDIPQWSGTHKRRIAFLAEGVPSVGYKTFYVKALDHPYRTPGSMILATGMAGNDIIDVAFEGNGTICTVGTIDKLPVRFWMTFEDGGDFGDGWNYRKPQTDTVVYSSSNDAQVSIVHDGPIRTTVKIDLVMNVPTRMHSNGMERSKQDTKLPITSYLTLNRGSGRVDIVTEVDNTARDHRLRVLFPGTSQGEFSNAESLYDVVTRPIKTPECRDWKEPMPTTHPQKSFVDVSDQDGGGLSVINEGLQEFEVKDDVDHTIALTLLRGVIGGMDSPRSQEQGQLLGKHTFRYAVYPHKGDWQQAQVWREAWAHNVPMRVVQTSIHAGDLPLSKSFVGIDAPEVVLSALKKADREDKITARVFNITETAANACGISIDGADKIFEADLNEELASAAPIGDNRVVLHIGAKKIKTLVAERRNT